MCVCVFVCVYVCVAWWFRFARTRKALHACVANIVRKLQVAMHVCMHQLRSLVSLCNCIAWIHGSLLITFFAQVLESCYGRYLHMDYNHILIWRMMRCAWSRRQTIITWSPLKVVPHMSMTWLDSVGSGSLPNVLPSTNYPLLSTPCLIAKIVRFMCGYINHAGFIRNLPNKSPPSLHRPHFRPKLPD